MTTQLTPAEIQARFQAFQVKDVEKLVSQNGRIQEGNTEITLKSPSTTDYKIKELLKEPSVVLKPTSGQTSEKERTYDLTANGERVQIRVSIEARR